MALRRLPFLVIAGEGQGPAAPGPLIPSRPGVDAAFFMIT